MAHRTLSRSHRRDADYDFEVGDLLEIKRGLYSHWALYCGNREVINMTGGGFQGMRRTLASNRPFTIRGVTNENAVIKKEKLWDVVRDGTVTKNNKLDSSYTPFSPAEILRRAKSQIGPVKYDVLWNNCEHFVHWCRYDKSVSKQAEHVQKGVKFAGALGRLVHKLSSSSNGRSTR